MNMNTSAAGAGEGAGASGETVKPTFRAYSSLQPHRAAETVATNLIDIAARASVLDANIAIVTPKIHGSNVQMYYAPGCGLKYGRRSAFLTPSEDHYGAVTAGKALGLDAKLASLFRQLATKYTSLSALAVFGEVYGGWYPHDDVPAAKPSRKPVQKGIWYAPAPALVAFDVQLVLGSSAPFMDFDAARAACEDVGIPFITCAFRGPVHEACVWATAHAADNALQYFNPLNLPLLPDNGGEGFVVRLQREAATGDARALAKIKNPAFSEVSCGKGGETKHEKMEGEIRECDVVARKYLNENRFAAVASKMSASDVTPKRMKALVGALVADALADPLMSATESAAVVEVQGARAFTAYAFTIVREFLASH